MKNNLIVCLAVFALVFLAANVSAHNDRFPFAFAMNNFSVLDITAADSGFLVSVRADTYMWGCSNKFVDFFIDSKSESRVACTKYSSNKCIENSTYVNNGPRVTVVKESLVGTRVYQNISYYYTYFVETPGIHKLVANSYDLECGGSDWGFDSHTLDVFVADTSKVCYSDLDNDGYKGNLTTNVSRYTSCPNNYYVADYFDNLNIDCNDNNQNIHPGATELRNSIDDDCDGLIDEGFSVDNDHDGYDNNSDCDDNNPNLYRLLQAYLDNDRDTYGTGNLIQVCSGINLPLGYSTRNGDCNDSNSLLFNLIYGYRDADNDNYGAGNLVSFCALTLPCGYVSVNNDCNDNNAAIKPNAIELNNGVDDNCNGVIDEGFSNLGVNSVSNLHVYSKSNNSINWVWTNPITNFVKAIVYLNGVNVANTTNNYYNATGLLPSSTYTIRINTLGNGITNYTNVTNSAITLSASTSGNQTYNLQGVSSVSSIIGTSWVYLNYTNPAQLLTNVLILNGVNVANTTSNYFNFTNLLSNATYNFRIHSISTKSSINFSDFSINLKTLAIENNTIPGNNTNQTNNTIVIVERRTVHDREVIQDDKPAEENVQFVYSSQANNLTLSSSSLNDLSVKRSFSISWLLIFGLIVLILLIVLIVLLLRR